MKCICKHMYDALQNVRASVNYMVLTSSKVPDLYNPIIKPFKMLSLNFNAKAICENIVLLGSREKSILMNVTTLSPLLRQTTMEKMSSQYT